ncbi:hypothetical protein DL98DRAFT_580097 [Cadophora sp. DSE1049]|nr:hypothetical protein DL98DRAFT_580097 [Cadophora sp. DSE1049]
MLFGFSASDFVLLVQLAHRTFRNCQKAGEEYIEIACEVRYGCKNVLDSLDFVLEKYEGLKADGEASGGKKFWQRLRFGSKAEELGVIRGKLVTYTSTMSILIDTMQIKASDRVEGKIDDGFRKMTGEFESIRNEIVNIALRKRAEDRKGVTVSSLSLSTYAGDEKEVWKDFRRELVKKGFRSNSLDKYRLVLQAYMLQLDQSQLLDKDEPANVQKESTTSWWARTAYMETVNSLAYLHTTPDRPIHSRNRPAMQAIESTLDLGSSRINGEHGSPELQRFTEPQELKLQSTERDQIHKAATATKVSFDSNETPRRSPPLKPVTITERQSQRRRVRSIRSGTSSVTNSVTNYFWTTGKSYMWCIYSTGIVVPVELYFRNLPWRLNHAHKFDGNLFSIVQNLRTGPCSPSSIVHQTMSTLWVQYWLDQDLVDEISKEATYKLNLKMDPQCKERLDEGPGRIEKRAAVYGSSHPVQLANAMALLDGIVRYSPTSTISNTTGPSTTRQEIFSSRIHILCLQGSKGQSSKIQPFPRAKGGILRQPRERFPEDPIPIREGVAPRKDARLNSNGIPPDARWTKINRALVSPEVLEASRERFEAREDHVIILRVLSSAEIRAYAAWTKEVDQLQKLHTTIKEIDGLALRDSYAGSRTATRLRNALLPTEVDWATVKIESFQE